MEQCRLPTLSDHLRRCDLFGIPEGAARVRFREFMKARATRAGRHRLSGAAIDEAGRSRSFHGFTQGKGAGRVPSEEMRDDGSDRRIGGNGFPAIRTDNIEVPKRRAGGPDAEQEKEGFSIPAQQKLLQSYAANNRLIIVQEYVDIETAKATGRTNFEQMVRYLKTHPNVRTVLVEKTDRLCRNLRDWVTLDELDIEIHLVKEGVILSRDSKSSEKFVHGIKVLMAKNYEEVIAEKFSQVLGRLSFGEEVLQWISTALRESHADQRKEHDAAIARLQAECEHLQNRIHAMYIDKLDGRIDRSFYVQMSEQWRVEQEKMMQEITLHQAADQCYLDEGVRLLELAQSSQSLFAKQEPNEKRRLLNFVLSNSIWKRGELSITFRQPFDLIAETTTSGPRGGSGGGANPADCPIWWAFLDTYRTLCLVPSPEIREIFEQLRNEKATSFAY
jgi:hypothetical protein